MDLFNEARAKGTAEERDAYLSAACGGDAALRRQVEVLLRAHEQVGDFLQPTIVVGEDKLIGEGPGTVIGRYKLLQEIGEGGFGVVFMAEQLEPVQRKVALKIIKAGMDTREVIARFEAERQALALMDHPNIARVLDAGATESGRPYFRDGTGQGHPHHGLLRPERPPDRGTPEAVHEGLPRGAARAPKGDHSPRPQTVQRDGDVARRGGGAESD